MASHEVPLVGDVFPLHFLIFTSWKTIHEGPSQILLLLVKLSLIPLFFRSWIVLSTWSSHKKALPAFQCIIHLLEFVYGLFPPIDSESLENMDLVSFPSFLLQCLVYYHYHRWYLVNLLNWFKLVSLKISTIQTPKVMLSQIHRQERDLLSCLAFFFKLEKVKDSTNARVSHLDSETWGLKTFGEEHSSLLG